MKIETRKVKILLRSGDIRTREQIIDEHSPGHGWSYRDSHPADLSDYDRTMLGYGGCSVATYEREIPDPPPQRKAYFRPAHTRRRYRSLGLRQHDVDAAVFVRELERLAN